MLSATIKGMLAHKLRLFLTATSIALGVAFLSGTLMLSSSLQGAFDDLFASVEGGSDTVVRAVSENDDQVAENERPPVPASLLDDVTYCDDPYQAMQDADAAVIAPMRSIHTAVEFWATLRMEVPRAPPVASARLFTLAT